MKTMKIHSKNRTLLAIISLTFLSACSGISQQKPVTQAEAAAAAQSVAALNGAPVGGVATSQYASVNGRRIAKVSYKPSLSPMASSTIAPQDTLDINVFKVPDLSAKSLKVESNGAISLPLIGSVRVAGLSIDQAEQTIMQRLSKYMQAPKVSVVRTDKAVSKRVTVEGEVKTPGVFPIKGNLSFLQAIAMAQGLTELANSRNVLFFRDGKQHLVNLDLVRTGQITDPLLRGDDRIIILKDKAKVREKKVIDYLPTVMAPFSLLGL